MKISLLSCLLSLCVAVPAFAAPVKSSQVKNVVAQAIETYAEDWEIEDFGAVWIVSYFKNVEGGNPTTFEFNVTRATANSLTVDVNFICGTDVDESELEGNCQVLAKKSKGQWTAKVKSCTCAGL
jgi:hypothetical protein